MFVPAALVTANNTFILLKHIESIGVAEADDAMVVIDKLKSDIRLLVRTVSGKEYVISMRHQMAALGSHKPPDSEYEYRDSIIKRWIDLGNTP